MKKVLSGEFWALIGIGLILSAVMIGWNFFASSDIEMLVITSSPAQESLPQTSGTSLGSTSVLSSGTEESLETSKININTASAEDLDYLPGIGAVLAERIVQYRAENGPFESLEEIKEVSGIGDATYEKIREFITLE